VSYVFISSLVLAVLGLFFLSAKNAKPIEAGNGDILLTYSTTIKWFCVGLSIFGLGFFSYIGVTMPLETESDKYAFAGVIAMLLLGLLYFYIEFFTVKIILRKSGISGTSGWRGFREYVWTEIDHISYSPRSMWFTISASNKAPLRVHGLITGIDIFQDHVMSNLPKDKWVMAYNNAQKDQRVNKCNQQD